MHSSSCGGCLETLVDFLDGSSGLTGLEKDTARKIQRLEGLIRRKPIDYKRGPIGHKILKLLDYGDQQMPGAQIRIAKIRKASGEFPQKQKGRKSPQGNYLRKEKE